VLSALIGHGSEIAHIHNTLAVASPAVFHAAKRAGAAVVHTLHNFRHVCLNGLLYRDGHPCEDCLSWRVPLPGVFRGCYRESISASASVGAVEIAHHLLRTFPEKVDLCVAPTEFVRSRMAHWGMPAERIVVKPHFAFDPVSQPIPYEMRASDPVKVVYAGRLAPEKGVRTLLQAWPNVREPRAELVIAGVGPLAGEAAAAAASDKRIKLAGQLSAEGVQQLIREAALVVVPSECYESFGRVTIEAFAMGTPVLVSGHGSLANIVRDGTEGRHFAPGNAADLAEKINGVLGSPQTAILLSKAGRQRFEEEFTADRNYAVLISIYRRAIDLARRRCSNE
jgi:glycosyltransferase involved in cell wall biosynthesis